jgi:putative addiction module antidote
MVYDLKLRKVGNSVGVIFPKQLLEHLKLSEGDHVYVTEAPGDGVRMTANAEVRRQMEVATDLMSRYRNTLRELAR